MDGEADDAGWRSLHEEAYAAFKAGQLGRCIPLFRRLADEHADRGHYEFMLGLAHKYRREWADCRRHNERALARARDGEDMQGEHWNCAIASTALGDWADARRHWKACGIDFGEGDSPIDDEGGVVSVRLNPWGDTETLFARRIGIARARLLNLPLAESGYRFGDLVLIDGAQTGQRQYGDATVPVLNVLQRLKASPWRTFQVRVDAASAQDAEALEDARSADVACIEDWSRSMTYFCRACSYGVPHAHAPREPDDAGWVRERWMGVAARSREAVEAIVGAWESEGRRGEFLQRLARRRPRRALLEIDDEEFAETTPDESSTWWLAPEPEPAEGDAT